jgi:hypothetical protein
VSNDDHKTLSRDEQSYERALVELGLRANSESTTGGKTLVGKLGC